MRWSFLGNMYFRCVCFWGVFFFFIIIHISRIYLILYNVCNRTRARMRVRVCVCVCLFFIFKKSLCAEISRYDHIVHDNIYNRSR